MNKQIDSYDIIRKRNQKSPWSNDPGRDFEIGLESDEYNIWPQALCVRFECVNCGSEIQRNRIKLDDIVPEEGTYDISGELVGIKIKNCICPVCKQKHYITFSINDTIGWIFNS